MCKIFGGRKEGHPHHSTQQAGWARWKKMPPGKGWKERKNVARIRVSRTDQPSLGPGSGLAGGQKQVSLGGSDTS